MDERIAKGLAAQFEKHRIVFWYDNQRDMQHVFNALELPNIEKLEVSNNEFGLKYRILREEAEQKFLLYHNGPPPELPKNNWLYDVERASGVFNADQISIWLADLDLPHTQRGLIEEHRDFFKSAQRLKDLKSLLRPEDPARAIKGKMICAATGSTTFDEAIERLLADLASKKDDKLRLLQRTGLHDFLWSQISTNYGYTAETPDLEDFALELFKTAFARAGGQEGDLSDEAYVFFGRWENQCAVRSRL